MSITIEDRIVNRKHKYCKYILWRKNGKNHDEASAKISVDPTTIRRWIRQHGFTPFSTMMKRKSPRYCALEKYKQDIFRFIRSEQNKTRHSIKKVAIRQFIIDSSWGGDFRTKNKNTQNMMIRKFLEKNEEDIPTFRDSPRKYEDEITYPCSEVNCTRKCERGSNCVHKRLCNRNHRDSRRDVKAVYCHGKGMGLFLYEKVRKNDFIIEYFGKVISSVKELECVGPNPYLMSIVGTEKTIDGKVHGNLAKYINHSCDPNCKAEIWNINGEDRVAIIALCAISPGTELTFDYGWRKTPGGTQTRCLCGSSNCRTFIEK